MILLWQYDPAEPVLYFILVRGSFGSRPLVPLSQICSISIEQHLFSQGGNLRPNRQRGWRPGGTGMDDTDCLGFSLLQYDANPIFLCARQLQSHYGTKSRSRVARMYPTLQPLSPFYWEGQAMETTTSRSYLASGECHHHHP